MDWEYTQDRPKGPMIRPPGFDPGDCSSQKDEPRLVDTDLEWCRRDRDSWRMLAHASRKRAEEAEAKLREAQANLTKAYTRLDTAGWLD